MTNKAIIKPTKASFIIGIIVLSLFLGFGIFFFFLLSEEPDSYIGQGFLIFWNLIVLILLIFLIYSLKNFDKKNILGTEIVVKAKLNNEKPDLEFDEKLKKLESLKNEGLISDEEYKTKRKEIMNENW
jgi:hypothetical protein